MGGKDGRAGLGHTWGCRGILPPHAQHGGGSRLRRHVRAGCMHSSAAVCTCDTTSTSTVSIVPLPSTAAEGTASHQRCAAAQPRLEATDAPRHQQVHSISHSKSSSVAEVQGRQGTHQARGWSAPTPAASGVRRRSWSAGWPRPLRRAPPPAAALLAAGRRPRPLAAAARAA